MKRLIVAISLLAVTCAFAEPVANQKWVAQQITNAVTDVTASFQAGDTLLQASITNEVANRIAANSQLMTALQNERAARQAGDEIQSTIISNQVEDIISQRDFSNSSWVSSVGVIRYTEHPVLVNLGDGSTVSCAGDWPEGKPVYLRVVPAGSYSVNAAIHYMGYGSWPTTPYQAVIWASNGSYYLNVLFVENQL